jgi:hypothetical protein
VIDRDPGGQQGPLEGRKASGDVATQRIDTEGIARRGRRAVLAGPTVLLVTTVGVDLLRPDHPKITDRRPDRSVEGRHLRRSDGKDQPPRRKEIPHLTVKNRQRLTTAYASSLDHVSSLPRRRRVALAPRPRPPRRWSRPLGGPSMARRTRRRCLIACALMPLTVRGLWMAGTLRAENRRLSVSPCWQTPLRWLCLSAFLASSSGLTLAHPGPP